MLTSIQETAKCSTKAPLMPNSPPQTTLPHKRARAPAPSLSHTHRQRARAFACLVYAHGSKLAKQCTAITLALRSHWPSLSRASVQACMCVCQRERLGEYT